MKNFIKEFVPVTLWVLFILWALAAITGCTRTVIDVKVEYPGFKRMDIYSVEGVSVYDFTTKDGTRCIAQYKGGVDCDWASARR